MTNSHAMLHVHVVDCTADHVRHSNITMMIRYIWHLAGRPCGSGKGGDGKVDKEWIRIDSSEKEH